MLSVERCGVLRRIHPFEVFQQAADAWKPDAHVVSDFENYQLYRIIPPYLAAHLDCEERKLGGH